MRRLGVQSSEYNISKIAVTRLGFTRPIGNQKRKSRKQRWAAVIILTPGKNGFYRFASVLGRTSVVLTYVTTDVITSVVELHDFTTRRSHTWRPSDLPSGRRRWRPIHATTDVIALIGRRSLLLDIIDTVTQTLYWRTLIVSFVLKNIV